MQYINKGWCNVGYIYSVDMNARKLERSELEDRKIPIC